VVLVNISITLLSLVVGFAAGYGHEQLFFVLYEKLTGRSLDWEVLNFIYPLFVSAAVYAFVFSKILIRSHRVATNGGVLNWRTPLVFAVSIVSVMFLLTFFLF